MFLFYLVQSRDEARQQRRAPREVGDQHVLVGRVRTIARRPEAV
jgi:hypothetical protein